MILYTIFKALLVCFLLENDKILVQFSLGEKSKSKPDSLEISASGSSGSIIPTSQGPDTIPEPSETIFISPDCCPDKVPRPNHSTSELPEVTSSAEDDHTKEIRNESNTEVTGVELNVILQETKCYSLRIKNYVGTYTPRSGYLFNSAKQFTDKIWEAKSKEEYSNKVVADFKTNIITIYQLNNTKRMFNKIKTGCCRKSTWEEVIEVKK